VSGPGNITGSPKFTGGAKPVTYADYAFMPRSPGKGTASDGGDIGVRYRN
jgi:hypothetical protein